MCVCVFICVLVCVYMSVCECVCMCVYICAHTPSLLLHFWLISSATYRLEYELQCVESFSMDPFGCKYSWNDAKEDGGKKECFGACGHDPRLAAKM